MQLQSLKIVVALGWISVASASALAVRPDSVSGWAAFAGIVLLPPLVMSWRWADPPESLSESIQKARR